MPCRIILSEILGDGDLSYERLGALPAKNAYPKSAPASNDVRAGGRFRLSRNVRIGKDDSRESILACIAAVAAAAPGGRLKSLVLNSHAAPG